MDANTPEIRLIQASLAGNDKIVKILLEYNPECKCVIVAALCANPDPTSDVFQTLVKSADNAQLLEAAKDVQTLLETPGLEQTAKVKAEIVREYLLRERAKRELKRPSVALFENYPNCPA